MAAKEANKLIDAFLMDNLPADFGSLHRRATSHFGFDCYRKVDARLQVLRRHDLIEFEQEGRMKVWRKK